MSKAQFHESDDNDGEKSLEELTAEIVKNGLATDEGERMFRGFLQDLREGL